MCGNQILILTVKKGQICNIHCFSIAEIQAGMFSNMLKSSIIHVAYSESTSEKF